MKAAIVYGCNWAVDSSEGNRCQNLGFPPASASREPLHDVALVVLDVVSYVVVGVSD